MNIPARNKELLSTAMKKFNQPILDNLSVVRLIGYGETGFDNYWILKSVDHVYWISCACSLISLSFLKSQDKSSIDTTSLMYNDYEHLNNLLRYNGCPEEETFLLVIKHNDKEPDVFGPSVGNELTGDSK